MNKPYFVSTPIYYVNAKPHIGHAYTALAADVLARLRRLEGREVFFLTGTDENALKNVQAAERAGKTTEAYVAENSEYFRSLSVALNLSNDVFMQTTEERHFRGAQRLWSALKPEDIYKKKYQGLYCVGCEEFKMEKDLVDGLCPEHQKAPEKIEEENYFFRLSAYQEKLKNLIATGELKIVPEFRKNEVLSFLEMGLEDLSISRSRERAKNWGVPVPGDDTQIMYVWIDALSNYINALNYADDGELYQKFWKSDGDRVHIMGKGIIRFHAIYWPALLLSAGLPLPTEIFAHEYLIVDNQKISKSLGNAVEPRDLLEKFGIDGTRYLLLSSLPYSKDGDVTMERLTEKYNADLANGLGNLVSRVVKLSSSLKKEFVPNRDFGSQDTFELLAQYRFAEALKHVWEKISLVDQAVDTQKPWNVVKTDYEAFEKIELSLLQEVYEIAILLRPFLPETAEKIEQAMQKGKTEPLFQRIK